MLFGYGIRRFEALRHFRPFIRRIEPNLTEYRFVSLWNFWDYLQRRRSGIPPIYAARFVARSNPNFLRNCFMSADIVQYEGPWLFPYYPARKPRVLIAHNVEISLSEKKRVSDKLKAKISSLEQDAWRQADQVICFTCDDRDEMISRYGERAAFVLPIGVDTEAIYPPTEAQRTEARRKLGVKNRFVVLFTGSWHIPNRAVLALMNEWSHQHAEHEVLWVAAGSVGNRSKSSANFIQTGELPDMQNWFQAADCCINPLSEGSGMNVKMLDYLAYGIPVISSPFGARGICIQDGTHALIRDISQVPQALGLLKASTELRRRLSHNGRQLIEEHYAWEVISKKRLALLQNLFDKPLVRHQA
jgi:glycosyltransferase involved in cell wall biosynthesis